MADAPINAAKWSYFWQISGRFAPQKKETRLVATLRKDGHEDDAQEFHVWSQRLQFTSEIEALMRDQVRGNVWRALDEDGDDEDEYHAIYALYGECFRRGQKQAREQRTTLGEKRLTLRELFEPVRKEYERMTGMVECHHNAILHHRISTYGPPCSRCGKPLRTPRAHFCAACGQVVSL